MASGALLLHLVPTYIVVIALVIAWRREWVGAVVFNALAVSYVVWAWGRFPFGAYLSVSGPLVLVGVLFLFNWTYRAQLLARRGIARSLCPSESRIEYIPQAISKYIQT